MFIECTKDDEHIIINTSLIKFIEPIEEDTFFGTRITFSDSSFIVLDDYYDEVAANLEITVVS